MMKMMKMIKLKKMKMKVMKMMKMVLEVERVQISCWEGTSRPAIDPPCCRCVLFSFSES